MKQGIAAGPSGVFAEMLKAAGEEGLENLRLLAELVFISSILSKDREKSLILNLYKGKGEALDRGNYRGPKIISEYYQEIRQSKTADNPMTPRRRATHQSRDTRKTN